ncbi:MAG: TerB family tellurite resistance protein [Proteobacteria bacterium]|nr:TerB family tellurite resistance protein [Pseudomonadota bacterium]
MLARLLDRIRQPQVDQKAAEADLALAAAVLFLEVAWADHDIASEELDVLRNALRSTFGLSQADAEEVVQAGRQHHDESVGIYGFTRAINETWPLARRVELVMHLWRLAFADLALSKYEEYTIRKISDMLYVGHGDFIKAKLLAKRASSSG